MSIEHSEDWQYNPLKAARVALKNLHKEYSDRSKYLQEEIDTLNARNKELEAALADVHERHWFLSESIKGRTLSAQFDKKPIHPLLIKED